jgi:hypothetical protein
MIKLKGLNYFATDEKVGKKRMGKNGKVYIVKKNKSGNKRWIISDFYKQYKKSEKKLKILLYKSPIKYNFCSIEEQLQKNKNWFKDQSNNITFPEISISFKFNKIGQELGQKEFQKCAYESEFFKFVINTGSDYDIKNSIRTYFYIISPDFTLWKDFNKEFTKFKKK